MTQLVCVCVCLFFYVAYIYVCLCVDRSLDCANCVSILAFIWLNCLWIERVLFGIWHFFVFAIFVLANHRMLKGFESFSFQLNETNFENFCYSCCAMAVSSYVSLIIFVNMYVYIFVWLFSICRSNAFLTSRRNKMNGATSTV